jgi:hypothetical protein
MTDLCIYCGAIATERDHLKPRRPRIWLGFISSDTNYIKTVTSCSQCNNTLQGCQDYTVRGRATFLIEKYQTKNMDSERMRWLENVALVEKD